MPDLPMPDFSIGSILAGFAVAMAIALLISLFMYVYLGITLMIMARKTGTANGWMAWVPICNIFLMCFIGKRSGWWFLALFIPIFNLFVFGMLWASMAAARGKPSWAGVLFLLPPFTLIVPAYLAAGKANIPSAGPPVCGACKTPAATGEVFCGNCGQPIGAAPAATWQVPLLGPALAAAAMFVLYIGLMGAGGWFVFVRGISYSPPVALAAPAIPGPMAGSMTELPVDTDPASPTIPISIVSQNLEEPAAPGDSGKDNLTVPKDWLPPGMTGESLPDGATAMTSAVYAADPAAPVPAGATPPSANPADDQVYVHVVDTSDAPPGEPSTLTRTITSASGAAATPVRIDRPDGGTYTGSAIRGADSTTYVLQREGVTIVIYARSRAMRPVAERLAKNVGNVRTGPARALPGAMAVLPARLPAGLVLQGAKVQGPEQMFGSKTGGRPGKPDDTPEIVRRMIPKGITQAVYRDDSRQDWNALVFDYGSSRSALNTWLMFRWTIGLKGWNSTTVAGVNGLSTDLTAKTGSSGKSNDPGGVLLFQKGPYLIILGSPVGTPASRLVELGNAFQL